MESQLYDDEGYEIAFDTYDTRLYTFDDMDRKGAEELLRVSDVGTFLIRRSVTKPNSYSLSVRISLEDGNSVRHFIIEQKQQAETSNFVYTMNGTEFRDIPTLVTHFTINPLGSSNHHTFLRQPAPKKVIEMVRCTSKFCGQRATDLPFNHSEILEILEKPEDEWFIARNAMGAIGFIPSNYVEVILEQNNEDEFVNVIDRDSVEYRKHCEKSGKQRTPSPESNIVTIDSELDSNSP